MTRAVLLVAVSLAVLVGVAGQTPAGRTPSSSDSVMIQTFAPLLASWIAYERDAAKKQGAEPIPPPIRAALEGYVPEPILVMKREGLIPKVQAAEPWHYTVLRVFRRSVVAGYQARRAARRRRKDPSKGSAKTTAADRANSQLRWSARGGGSV